MSKRHEPEAFLDLHRMKEDERIALIAHTVVTHHKRVAFVTEKGEKAERYIRKLLAHSPLIICKGPLPGLVPGVVTIIAQRTDDQRTL